MKNSVLLVFILLSVSLNAQIRINEILALNSSVVDDPDFGEFSDFIELHNTAAYAINLQNYSITDDPDTKKKWILPSLVLSADQYLIIWADGESKYPGERAYSKYKNDTITTTTLHANFNVNSLGETIYLYSNHEELEDSLKLDVQEYDISIGRNIQNYSEWHYYSEPTPGKVNSSFGSRSLNYASEPVFSIDEGFYPSAQQLQISSVGQNSLIRFTVDGTTPNEDSPVLSGSFNVARNYVIKARAYEPGKLPGKVITKSYFINENIDLPVISISTDNSNFYDFDYGILQNGMKEREVPVYVEYFDLNKQRKFNVNAGAKLFGSTIFNLPQRPISIGVKSKYGDDKINYKLFNDRESSVYYSFLLRNGGNDYNLSYFREGLSTSLIKNKMDVDYQAYQPCVVFINGQYNGIYEIRERLDENFISNSHYTNNANLDLLEDSLRVVSGSKYNYQNLIHFIENNDLGVADNYQYVQEQVDIHEFTNYIIHKIFIGYWIVDLNNKYWRNNDTQSKWRWIANDNEHAFGKLGGDNYMDNTLSKVSGITGNLPDWSTFLFRNLLKNEEFKNDFIQRTSTYLNTVFNPAVTLPITDSLKAVLSLQMPRHINKWGTPLSLSFWHSNIDFIKTFLQYRGEHVRQHITTQFGIQDSAQVEINIGSGGDVSLCDVLLGDSIHSGYYFINIPIKLKASPKPGYKFIEWQGTGNAFPEIVFVPGSDTSITAVFAPNPISIIPPLIQSDTILSATHSPWYGLEDVIIKPGAKLIVEPGVEIFICENKSIYVEGGLKISGSPDSMISIRVDTLYSNINDKEDLRWGSIIADNPSDSVLIQYVKFNNGSYGNDRAKYFSTIAVYNTNIRFEHSEISDGGPPFYADGGNVYIANSTFHTHNNCNGFVSLNNVINPIVENCSFKGNKATDTDGLDLKGVTNALVRNNHIHDFSGTNCDGIDFGINSVNNIVEGNMIYNCTDKGISIGSQSNATIYRNLIFDCGLGIGVKDSLSFANLNQNTLYRNHHSIACYEKSTLRGGGKAFIQNSILAGSLFETVSLDDKSEVEINYSLSDKELLSGNHNIFDDPQFIHATAGNLQLKNTSPCIDSGNPLSPYDPDSSIADIGAYYTHFGNNGLTVHINEINYHPADNYNTGDWVEIFNRTSQVVDLSGWKLGTGKNDFSLKQNTLILPGEYLVICEDTLLFKSKYPGINNIDGNFFYELDNKSDKVSLYDHNGTLVHSIRYSDSGQWPALADGRGATLELNESKDGNLVQDWHESFLLMGSPGTANTLPPDFSGLFINEVMASNNGSIADDFNEYDDWFEIYNSTGSSINLGGLYLTDQLSNYDKHQLPLNFPTLTTIPAGGYYVLWADNQIEQGTKHVAFKLNASGESLGFYQRSLEDYLLIDSLSFSFQNFRATWGRYPDGTTTIRYLEPTPNLSNVLKPEQEDINSNIIVFPNPAKNELRIRTMNHLVGSDFTIYSAIGQKILTGKIEAENTFVNISNLLKGVYFISVHPEKPVKLMKY